MYIYIYVLLSGLIPTTRCLHFQSQRLLAERIFIWNLCMSPIRLAGAEIKMKLCFRGFAYSICMTITFALKSWMKFFCQDFWDYKKTPIWFTYNQHIRQIRGLRDKEAPERSKLHFQRRLFPPAKSIPGYLNLGHHMADNQRKQTFVRRTRGSILFRCSK
jgi:hypothetical protein